MIYVKNISGATKTWVGQQMADGAYFLIDNTGTLELWAQNETFIKDYASGLAKIARDNSGSNDINDFITGLNELRRLIPQKTQQILGTDEKKTLRHGDFFTAAANATTHCDLLVQAKYLNGIFLEFQNSNWLDHWTMVLGDKDGVVVPQSVIDASGGFYPVAESQIPKSPVGTQILVDFESGIMSDAIPSGLYYRLSYTNTHATRDVDVIFFMRGFKDK